MIIECLTVLCVFLLSGPNHSVSFWFLLASIEVDLDQISQEDTDNDSELESHDQPCYHGDKDAECSDDEMVGVLMVSICMEYFDYYCWLQVFEAYVPPHEVEIERDSSVDQLTEKEKEEIEVQTTSSPPSLVRSMQLQ